MYQPHFAQNKPSPVVLMAIALLATASSLLAVVTPTAAASQSSSASAAVHPSTPEATNHLACVTSPASIIDAVLARPQVAASGWGIMVQPLRSETILYSHNPNRLLIPASNIKLLTTAAALQSLGSQHRIGSTSLGSWVTTVNRYSDNDYADSLLRRLGGPQSAQKTLTQLGINPKHYRQVDGSGLSRSNLATPATLVKVLQAMSQTSHWQTFYRSLPVSGVNGTLQYRLNSDIVKGQVRAKTGTLSGVRALSGYLQHPTYGPVVFSILANQSSQSGDVLVDTIDDIVWRLTRFRPCG